MLSLGGEYFSGIIVDPYTDFVLNPANLWFIEGRRIDYAWRLTSDYSFPFPYVNENFGYMENLLSSARMNEIIFFGPVVRGWKLALLAEWKLNSSEDNSTQYDISQSNYYYESVRNSCRTYGSDYMRVEFSAAREAGNGLVAGFRIGGLSRYYKNQDRLRWTRIRVDETLYYAPEPFVTEEIFNDNLNDDIRRNIESYMEIGIASSDGSTSISLNASRSSSFSRQNRYDLGINYDFDEYGVLNKYYYDLEEYYSRMEGDSWEFGLFGRHAFDGGITLCLEAYFETASFESYWWDDKRAYDWSDYRIRTRDFRGDGDSRRSSLAVKAGKRIAINDKLDVIAGGYASYRSETTDIQGICSSRHDLLEVEIFQSTRTSRLSGYCRTLSRFDIAAPIAFEFRPSGYFSYYAGIFTALHADRIDEDIPVILDDTTSGGHIIPETIEDYSREIYTACNYRTGFSLNYRESYRISFYTESELLPANRTSYCFDLSLGF